MRTHSEHDLRPVYYSIHTGRKGRFRAFYSDAVQTMLLSEKPILNSSTPSTSHLVRRRGGCEIPFTNRRVIEVIWPVLLPSCFSVPLFYFAPRGDEDTRLSQAVLSCPITVLLPEHETALGPQETAGWEQVR